VWCMRKHYVALAFLVVFCTVLVGVVVLHQHAQQQESQQQISEIVREVLGDRYVWLIPFVFILLSYLVSPRSRGGIDVPLPADLQLGSDALPLVNQQTLRIERIPLSDVRRIVFGAPRYVLARGFQELQASQPWVQTLSRNPLDNWLHEIIGVEFVNGTKQVYRTILMQYFRTGDLSRADLSRIIKDSGVIYEGDVDGMRTGSYMTTRGAVIVLSVCIVLGVSILITRYVLFPDLFIGWDWNR